MVRLNEKKRRQGLTYAAVTLLIIALPIVVVLGVGRGVDVLTAEVVRMKERKKEKRGGGLTAALVITLPIVVIVGGTVGVNIGVGVVGGCWVMPCGVLCGGGGGVSWVHRGCVVVVVVGWVVWLNEPNVGSNLVMQLVT